MDVMATDLAVTALAERAPIETDDRAVRLLAAWAADIDAHPVAVDVQVPVPAATRRRPRGALRSVAVMTLALTVSSSGIAAAVQGNPLAPLNFMVDKFGHLGDHDRPPSVDLLGNRSESIGRPPEKVAGARAKEHRPSRTAERQTTPASAATSGAEAGDAAPTPIVSHRVPHSAGSRQAQEPQAPRRHRQGPLVIRDPDPTVHRPSGGQTPPHHPELPSIPGQPSTPKPIWPRPESNERPVPPDKPAPAEPDGGSLPIG